MLTAGFAFLSGAAALQVPSASKAPSSAATYSSFIKQLEKVQQEAARNKLAAGSGKDEQANQAVAAQEQPSLFASEDQLTPASLHEKVVAICESAVRKSENTQCSDLDLIHEYISSPIYHSCLDDWEGIHGLASECEKQHAEIHSSCGKACLYKGLRQLASKHGAVSELLKWGVTDFNLWNQLVVLAQPSADGISEEELAGVFKKCADGGDMSMMPIPRVRHIFGCLDANADGALDGAELTQPTKCFRGCLETKEPAGHLEKIPDDADVTDVLSLWISDAQGAARKFDTLLAGSGPNCLDGLDGPCEGCESYHVDFNPMEKREKAETEAAWDETGDLLEECEGFEERCEPHLSGDSEGASPECSDPYRRQYCIGVQRLTESHMQECAAYYGQCCKNANDSPSFHLTQCEPCKSGDDHCEHEMVEAGSEQGGCFAPAAVGFDAAGRRQLDYQRLAFCAGVFERARYDMLESGKLLPSTDATTMPDDVGGNVHPGLLFLQKDKSETQEERADNLSVLALMAPMVSMRQVADRSKEVAEEDAELDSLDADEKDVENHFEFLARQAPPTSAPAPAQEGAVPGTSAPLPPATGTAAAKPLPLVPSGDSNSPMNLSPQQQAAENAAPINVRKVREMEFPAHDPVAIRPLNADLAHAPGAVPQMQAGEYDATVHDDVIREPQCPTETFREKTTGELKVVRNEEYYKKFCAWMGEVAQPSAGWDLGHFVDPATKTFADRQFVPDGTCSAEIVVSGDGRKLAAGRKRAEFDDTTYANCKQAHKVCAEAGNLPNTPSCGYLESEICAGYKFPALPEPPVVPDVDVNPAAGSSEPEQTIPAARPKAVAGAIPAATGEAGESLPLGTGAELPGAAAPAGPGAGAAAGAPGSDGAKFVAATKPKVKAALGIKVPPPAASPPAAAPPATEPKAAPPANIATVAEPIVNLVSMAANELEGESAKTTAGGKPKKRQLVFKVTVEEE